MMQHGMRTVRSTALALGTVLLLIGCAATGGDQQWSTKEQSIPGGGRGEPALRVDASIAAADRSELRDAALGILRQAVESPNPLLRANALEAMQHANTDVSDSVRRSLGDPNRGVRFIAAMSVGQLALCDLIALVHPLLHDESESVQAAAIFAMRTCGDDVDLNPLASMILSNNPEVRANAALVLGELGNPSAVPMLRRAIGRGMARVPAERARIVDLQLAEAIVRLGDEREMEVIRAALFAPVAEQGEIVALACLMCGRLGDARVVPNLRDLALREGRRQLPPEIRMAATMALAQIQHGDAPFDVPLLYATSDRYEHRAQAAVTLGYLDHPSSLNVLRQLMADSNPIVQISAAGGTLQRLNALETLELGLSRNLLRY